MDFKPLPIGVDDFEKLILMDYYYVDKTLFIKELIDNHAEVNLITRPRRFGKTLNMKMLKCFFENNINSSKVFQGLNIMKLGKKYSNEMNQYPVIFITLKDVSGDTYHSAFYQAKSALRMSFRHHDYLLESEYLDNVSKDKMKDILDSIAKNEFYSGSIQFLTECLFRHFRKKVLILIDEYDVPLENAYFNGYYDQMVNFIRTLFGTTLKSNDYMFFSVLTGCLRVSKESIFTGLNNLNIVSVTSERYGEYFGLTDDEVKKALKYYQLSDKYDEMKLWYNGYLFGNVNVYNPWSSIKYLDDVSVNKNAFPKPHWANTSSNNIIRELIEIAGETARDEIELLIRGGSITKPIYEDIVYEDIKKDINYLWNFLFFTGYLKKIDKTFIDRKLMLTMCIPNEEVLYIYERRIEEWFDEKIKIDDSTSLLNAILQGNVENINNELNKRLMDVISFHDSAENFYHGYLLGILSNIRGYKVKSNRESGIGRSDIIMKSTGIRRRAVIFECKALKEKDNAEEVCIQALKQIDDKKYVYDLEADGYQEIYKYAVAFRGKECLVMK